MYMQRKKQSAEDSVLFAVSVIHWGSWDTSPQMGTTTVVKLHCTLAMNCTVIFANVLIAPDTIYMSFYPDHSDETEKTELKCHISPFSYF